MLNSPNFKFFKNDVSSFSRSLKTIVEGSSLGQVATECSSLGWCFFLSRRHPPLRLIRPFFWTWVTGLCLPLGVWVTDHHSIGLFQKILSNASRKEKCGVSYGFSPRMAYYQRHLGKTQHSVARKDPVFLNRPDCKSKGLAEFRCALDHFLHPGLLFNLAFSFLSSSTFWSSSTLSSLKLPLYFVKKVKTVSG